MTLYNMVAHTGGLRSGGRRFLRFHEQLYLVICLHFETNSDLLFKSVAGSAIAIIYFSLKHKSQRLETHLYGAALCAILQLMSPCISASFNSHMYLDSSVSVLLDLCLKEQV